MTYWEKTKMGDKTHQRKKKITVCVYKGKQFPNVKEAQRLI